MIFAHKPDWIYALLPIIYVVSGVVVIVGLNNGYAWFSGGLLMSSGVLITYLRWSYRKAVRVSHTSSHGVLPVEKDPRDSKALKLVWHPEFECGNPEIDDQHRHLFGLSNQLIHAISTGMPKSEIEFFLDALLHDLSFHFVTEERVLAKSGHPITKPHRKVHTVLEERCRKLVDQYRANQVDASVLIGFLAFDIVAMHIAREDRMFIGQV